jgi:outer membrane PBP1 activator LpoA protein
LILPAKDSAFGRAADLARQGFMAARGVAEVKLEVQVFETDGTAESAAQAVERAQKANACVIVGPLTRAEVGGVARLPVKVPTLALNTPENEMALPHNFYALSLNTEAEARAAAHAAWRAESPVAVVVTTPAPLARRAAAAFGDAWSKLGGRMREPVEFTGSLGRVRQAVDRAQADIIFLATDADRARLLRPYLGRNAQVIGTSQVFGGAPRNEAARPLDLNGVRFVDMPWLHQPDHAATMVYPRPDGALAPDLERLYALGIDAYRVALELARDRTGFEVDGVTGNLKVREGVIEREPLVVEYRDGATLPVR